MFAIRRFLAGGLPNRVLRQNVAQRPVTSYLSHNRPNFRLCLPSYINKRKTVFKKAVPKLLLALSILKWIGFEEEDEKKDSELIMTLKRAVLCTQREQYDKAEQMLHLALRIAQQQQNQQGVIYCFDLMANLAFERFDLDKAEKLFVSVLQMLLGSGLEQEDLKVLHHSTLNLVN